jgi:hypothetical protein
MTEPIQNLTKMQTDLIGRVMGACEAQVTSPNPMASVPSEIMAQMKFWPGFSFPGSYSGSNAFSGPPTNPVQFFWIQWGEQWQKNWEQMMASWSGSPPRSDGR